MQHNKKCCCVRKNKRKIRVVMLWELYSIYAVGVVLLNNSSHMILFDNRRQKKSQIYYCFIFLKIVAKYSGASISKSLTSVAESLRSHKLPLFWWLVGCGFPVRLIQAILKLC